ncbi:MAG: Xaa-Pro peptidase family protein [Verrucomicrobiae bacterium]|jgi:Xaa-Pro aminopeptidase|nr:Xaa-Pro peptidase family protein [Verrucomicrobiae bacterium]
MQANNSLTLQGNSHARLLISESQRGADMFYATGFRAPDDFVYLEHDGQKILLLHDLEIDRGRREASVDQVISWSLVAKEAGEELQHQPSEAEVIAFFIKKRGISHLEVPATFSLSLGRSLEALECFVETREGLFFPERALKKPQEIEWLRRASQITEVGMERAIEILRKSRIGKNNALKWSGKLLTSERLRHEVEGAIYRAGGIPAGDSIIAGGLQACDPHERGHGILHAHQLIILDLFPRDAQSGYYGDLTRTVVRGKASEHHHHLWKTCLEGQQLAFNKIKPKASGKKIDEAVRQFFTQLGYPTEQKEGRWSGFFHGTGHGLGLELHEEPRFGKAILKSGHVFTIEPGLYIPGLGGVRHEDVITVTPSGYQLLSHFPKILEI